MLLVHGTSLTDEEHWGTNYALALPAAGYTVCTVLMPGYAFGDIQTSTEYVVHAIRRLHAATGRRIAVFGHSQGGIEPRWAIRWWPDIRETVEDLVMLAAPNHGAAFGSVSCQAPCLPALWQQAPGSNLLAALNAGDETPGAVDYTSIYSHTDWVIQPSLPEATAALDGAVNIAVQDLCPGRPVDHIGAAFDAAVHALVLDALRHPGPADPARIDPLICSKDVMPYSDRLVAAQRTAELYALAGYRQSISEEKVDEEPPLRDYARSDARQRGLDGAGGGLGLGCLLVLAAGLRRPRAWLVLPMLLAGCSGSGGGAPLGAGSFERFVFEHEAGTRSYKLYLPPDYTGAGPWPLLVELHGCSSDGDEEARWSRFNLLADSYRVLVAYPEQSAEANGSRCWNWFRPEHQSRGAGEPAIIAGITRSVMNQYAVDPRRVYIAGISAGAAMADILAVTYPDLYAAAMIYAGCEYMGTTCTAAVAALPAETSGEFAYQAMGEFARVVPVLVLQGDRDVQVPYPNAELIVGQFLASDDWADDSQNNGSIPREPAGTETGQVPGGHGYEIDTYLDAAGCVLARRWLVHGMGHAWSQGQSEGSARDMLFTDPLGPDLSRATLDFLLAHPMPPAMSTACHQEPVDA